MSTAAEISDPINRIPSSRALVVARLRVLPPRSLRFLIQYLFSLSLASADVIRTRCVDHEAHQTRADYTRRRVRDNNGSLIVAAFIFQVALH